MCTGFLLLILLVGGVPEQKIYRPSRLYSLNPIVLPPPSPCIVHFPSSPPPSHDQRRRNVDMAPRLFHTNLHRPLLSLSSPFAHTFHDSEAPDSRVRSLMGIPPLGPPLY